MNDTTAFSAALRARSAPLLERPLAHQYNRALVAVLAALIARAPVPDSYSRS